MLLTRFYLSIYLLILHQTTNAGISWPAVQRHASQLREHCCVGMSNLLSANCDVGLGHAIHMGYSVDVGVRLAFTEVSEVGRFSYCQVLTKVLKKQGAEFDALAEVDSNHVDRCAFFLRQLLTYRYQKLMGLVLNRDLLIVSALSEVASTDVLDELVQVPSPQRCFDSFHKNWV